MRCLAFWRGKASVIISMTGGREADTTGRTGRHSCANTFRGGEYAQAATARRERHAVIRILIADDHAILRRGLKEILMRELDGVTWGEAENGEQVLDQIQSRDWDLLILDITMPGRGGLDVLKNLKALRPRLPVLVLSMHPEDQYGKRVLKAGASGYMNKESAPEELMKAVRRLLGGGRYVSPALAETLASDLSQDTGRPAHESLSDREFEVLRKIASGKT